MEPEINARGKVTTSSTGIRFGLIGALVSISYFVILNLAGLEVTRGLWSWSDI